MADRPMTREESARMWKDVYRRENERLRVERDNARAALRDVIAWAERHNAQGCKGLAEFGLRPLREANRA